MVTLEAVAIRLNYECPSSPTPNRLHIALRSVGGSPRLICEHCAERVYLDHQGFLHAVEPVIIHEVPW